MERDPARKGVNLILKAGATPSTAQITLDLKDVSMLQALRYVTELAGMRYKVEPHAVVVAPITETTTELYTRTFKVPPDFLSRASASGAAPDPFATVAQANSAGLKAKPSAAGILGLQGPMPEGASLVFDPATSQLIARNTQANLDAIDAMVTSLSRGIKDYTASGVIEPPAAPAGGAGPGLLPADPFGDDDRRVATKSGLISLDLTVPSVGRLLTINGHQKPTALVLHYQTWERQIAWTVLRIVLGVALFCWLGRRRPWLLTVVAILLLTCVPVWLTPSWLAFANALLAGWILGFLFHLCRGLAHWLQKKFPLHLNFEAKGETV